jgi:hypothetical protein
MIKTLAAIAALLLTAVAASAQTTAQTAQQRRAPSEKRERVFLLVNGGVQTAAPNRSDTFTYDVNAEPAHVDVAYPGQSATLVDVSAAVRLWKSGGLAIGVSRASADGSAHVEADMPHPFFDNQDRHVSGEADRIERSETAIYLQLYMLTERGRWKLRVMGGGTYFRVEQDTVTEVNVNETFPFDTATFGSATTARADGSAPGFNVGADVTWMAAKTVGIGALVRYTRGSVELNAGGTRRVSVDVGGLQISGGLRFAF